MEMTSAFTLNVRLDNIAVITIDVPGEKMNTLKAEFASQVRAIIKQLRENKELRGVVFVSAKPDNFIAGADINMIGNCKTAQEAEALARQGQQLMAEIHALPIQVIAAIHGACLGGGLELAVQRPHRHRRHRHGQGLQLAAQLDTEPSAAVPRPAQGPAVCLGLRPVQR